MDNTMSSRWFQSSALWTSPRSDFDVNTRAAVTVALSLSTSPGIPGLASEVRPFQANPDAGKIMADE
jgi:hypothetical protein